MKILIVLFIYSFNSIADTNRKSLLQNQIDNCFINIKVTMKNGKIKKELKKYKFEKEEKCKNLSEIYKENFSPEYVQKVDTEYKWLK